MKQEERPMREATTVCTELNWTALCTHCHQVEEANTHRQKREEKSRRKMEWKGKGRRVRGSLLACAGCCVSLLPPFTADWRCPAVLCCVRSTSPYPWASDSDSESSIFWIEQAKGGGGGGGGGVKGGQYTKHFSPETSIASRAPPLLFQPPVCPLPLWRITALDPLLLLQEGGVTTTTGSAVMLLLLLEDEFTQPTQLRQRTWLCVEHGLTGVRGWRGGKAGEYNSITTNLLCSCIHRTGLHISRKASKQQEKGEGEQCTASSSSSVRLNKPHKLDVTVSYNIIKRVVRKGKRVRRICFFTSVVVVAFDIWSERGRFRSVGTNPAQSSEEPV